MGDVRTHADITHHVQSQLSSLRPSENYTYLEIGNFIRDVSQFRDPYAHFLAKNTVFLQAVQKVSIGRFAIPIFAPPIAAIASNEWINELLGEKEAPKRYGNLAQFFLNIAKFSAHYFFADDSKLHTIPSPSGPFTLFDPIAPDAVDNVFDATFTQYYPHEHLDLPPYREGPGHRNSGLYQKQQSGLIGYLEEQIQYMSEELSKIELEWVRNASVPQTLLLARLGRVLHAVEDYYFHSNYMEIYHWKRVLSRFPHRDPANEQDRNFLLLHSVRGANQFDARLMRRRFARRLRYPVYRTNTYNRFRHSHSQSESEDATDFLYTGGFAANDIFHTLHGAVQAFESLLVLDGISSTATRLLNTSLALLVVIQSEGARRRMVQDEAYAKRMIELHKEDLNQDRYRDGIEALRRDGEITNRGAAALQKAFEIDKQLENKNRNAPGVGGFIISFFKEAQRVVDESHEGSSHLNNSNENIFDISSDIGVTGELIGQHTLLAKDTNAQNPFREQSLNLAKHASACVGHLLVKRINEDTRQNRGLDWDSILRHYMRFPKPERASWERHIIDGVESTHNYSMPDVESVPDLANYRILGPGFGAEKLLARRNGEKREVLEERYHQMESRT